MNAQMGKLGAQGRLVTLKAMLDFLRHALGHQETDEAEGSNSSLPPGMFPDWLEDGPGGSKRKGKGKEKAVGYEGQTSMRDEGWVFGVGDWAIQTVNDLDWELARLQSHGVEDGKQGIETLSVSVVTSLDRVLDSPFLKVGRQGLTRRSISTSNSNLYFFPPSSSLLPLLWDPPDLHRRPITPPLTSVSSPPHSLSRSLVPSSLRPRPCHSAQYEMALRTSSVEWLSTFRLALRPPPTHRLGPLHSTFV